MRDNEMDSGLWTCFRCEPLMKSGQVDDHAGMRASADLLDLVASAHVEFDAAALDPGDHRFGGDAMANGRGSKVIDIDLDADRAFARVKIVPHRIQFCVLHRCHHYWGREYAGQGVILELIGQMARRNAQRVRPFRADGDGSHYAISEDGERD